MDDSKLAAHIGQERAARIMAAAFALAALVGLALGYAGPALALALMGGAFNMARPGPSDDLDRMTGRGR